MNQDIIAFADSKQFNIDKLYVDKFWNNINHKHWLYVDEELIKWVGYKESNGKFKYIDLIKKNFKNDEEFKIYDYEEITDLFHSPREENEINEEILRFKDKLTNIHNRTIHLIISPRCFKKSLMMIKTKRANEIRDYYVDVEELCFEFNKFLLEGKNKEIEQIQETTTKLIKHDKIRTQTLIDTFVGKCVVYLANVGKHIKFGLSNRVDGRMDEHIRGFVSFEILFIKECVNNRVIENKFKQFAKDNECLTSEIINGHNYTELIKLSDTITVDVLINQLNLYCENENNPTTAVQYEVKLVKEQNDAKLAKYEAEEANNKVKLLIDQHKSELNVRQNEIDILKIKNESLIDQLDDKEKNCKVCHDYEKQLMNLQFKIKELEQHIKFIELESKYISLQNILNVKQPEIINETTVKQDIAPVSSMNPEITSIEGDDVNLSDLEKIYRIYKYEENLTERSLVTKDEIIESYKHYYKGFKLGKNDFPALIDIHKYFNRKLKDDELKIEYVRRSFGGEIVFHYYIKSSSEKCKDISFAEIINDNAKYLTNMFESGDLVSSDDLIECFNNHFKLDLPQDSYLRIKEINQYFNKLLKPINLVIKSVKKRDNLVCTLFYKLVNRV